MRRPIWAHGHTVDSADSADSAVHPTCVGVGRSAQCSTYSRVYRVSRDIVTVQHSSCIIENVTDCNGKIN